MLGMANPVVVTPSLLASDMIPITLIYETWTPYPDFICLLALLFCNPLLRMLRTPTILTLLPGVTLSVRYLSQVSRNVLGISPVGISSGASCNLSDY